MEIGSAPARERAATVATDEAVASCDEDRLTFQA
jgi:hypothetical protein